MIKIMILSILLVSAASAHYWFRDYDEDWTAEEKSSNIWRRVEKTKGTGAWWSAWDGLTNWAVYQQAAFEFGDFVEHSYLSLWTQPRRKTVHTVGAVQRIKYVDLGGHGFTGLFSGNNDHGILRYSVSAQSVYLPGIAFKFFRDGVHSGNLQTVAPPLPNNTVQFMSGNFTNHIAESQGGFAKLAASKFAQTSPYTFTIGSSDFATYDASGSKVSGDPVFPFRIVFEPQVQIDESKNYPTEDENYDFTQPLLDSLNNGNQLLFKVYAYAEPADIKNTQGAQLIGEVWTNSEAVKSEFADYELQFMHNPWDWDLEYRPDWKGYVPEMEWFWPAIDWEDDTLNDKYAGWDVEQDKDLTVGSSRGHGCPFSFMQ